MEYQIIQDEPGLDATPCAVLAVYADGKLSEGAKTVNKAAGGWLADFLALGDFSAEPGETLMLYQVPECRAERVLLVGCGKKKSLSQGDWRKVVQGAAKALFKHRLSEASLYLAEAAPKGLGVYQAVTDLVLGLAAAGYRCDQLKSGARDKPAPVLERVRLGIRRKADLAAAEAALPHAQAIAEGVALTKDLANLPGNICTPTYLAEQAQTLGEQLGLAVEVLDEERMAALGMGSLLSVARGSRQPAKLIVLTHNGGKSDEKPVVLVGKGLTFDAGGISLKPAGGMDEMKYDMCGGAAVFGTLSVAARLALPLNLVGIVPASENLPDGEANKPGDIVTSMKGLTIEILNTDAEGRLILCDALTYAEGLRPAVVIDIATLTGACVVALGEHAAGLFGNDEALVEALRDAGTAVHDRAWPMPLWEDYQRQLESNFADLANIGGKEAGAVTAACFLARFTESMTWAHLDIAGVAWKSGKEKGATGRPVPLLTRYLLDRCRLSRS